MCLPHPIAPPHEVNVKHAMWPKLCQNYLPQNTSQESLSHLVFQLYRSEGIITQSQLKYACATSLIATLICLSGSYLHMQLMSKFTSFYKKFQSLSQDHLIIIFGSSSTSLSAHQIHKMLPANPLLDSGISNPSILQVISNSLSENLALFSTNLSSTGKLLNLEALGRPEDIFHDNSIQLKAIFAKQSFLRAELQPDIEMLDKKIIRITQELGTADFIVHHIHAFTIHVTLLILSKGVLYARNSRFVSDKGIKHFSRKSSWYRLNLGIYYFKTASIKLML